MYARKSSSSVGVRRSSEVCREVGVQWTEKQSRSGAGYEQNLGVRAFAENARDGLITVPQTLLALPIHFFAIYNLI
jgi:hypothetical protein